jgi:hypothetical protein
MIGRAFKIFSIVWLIGWLLTWALDIKGELEHPRDYSIVFPTGESRFNTRQFVAQMMDHGMGLFFLWPGAVYVEVGLHMGWVCKSAEIGRC